LNAAIEAARAGEHGRGFAVVANEVRRLSVATDAALDSIRRLSAEIEAVSRRTAESMRDVDVRVSAGIRVVEVASQSLELIVASIDATRDATHTIAEHAERQEERASIVAAHVASIAAAATDNAGSAEQVSTLAQSQRVVASTLHESTLRLASVANQLGSSLDGFTA
ncbi:MAG TPA: methyl-accepting chemotaxis protein, partial [Gemmatimonadaceae bacterium]